MQGNQLFLEFISEDEIDRIEAERAGQITLFTDYDELDIPPQMRDTNDRTSSLLHS